MSRSVTLTLLVSLGLLSCSGGGGADQAVESTVSDTQALREAEAAANEIIRNASDCQAVGASYASVMAKLDEVQGRLQTAVGRTTLGTLKKQVSTVGDACGAR